jgi:hypothetical protein
VLTCDLRVRRDLVSAAISRRRPAVRSDGSGITDCVVGVVLELEVEPPATALFTTKVVSPLPDRYGSQRGSNSMRPSPVTAKMG